MAGLAALGRMSGSGAWWCDAGGIVGSDGAGEVYLVVEGDAVVADPGDLRLVLPGLVDRAGAEFGHPEAAALVEAERIDVVVGGGEADLAAAEAPRLAHGGLDEHGPDPGATVDGVERDDLEHGADELVGEQAGNPAGPFGDEAAQLGGPQAAAVDRHGLRAPQLGDEPGQHRPVALVDGPDPDLRLLHPAIIATGGTGSRTRGYKARC